MNGVLLINYAHHKSKTTVRPATLEYSIQGMGMEFVDVWVSRLLVKAYGGMFSAHIPNLCDQARDLIHSFYIKKAEAIPGKRIKVIINPRGGRGNAQGLWASQCEPLFRAAHCKITVESTEYFQHALKIAEELDISSYDAVVCVSGDGVPHEIFNGFAKRKDAGEALRKIAVCPLPAGSGNGMCWTMHGTDSGSLTSLIYIKGVHTPIDLVSVTQGDKRILSVLSQSYGIVAESDLGTENLRWMGGARFTVGLLQRIWGKDAYPCDIAYKTVMDDKNTIKEYYRRGGDPPAEGETQHDGLPPLKYGTVNDELPDGWALNKYPTIGNFYAGNVSTTNLKLLC